jgi:threonine synthase|tara:strand:- start:14452 stop:15714 length:1263 start_codon:yes stop_codon:yes gene_type:complete
MSHLKCIECGTTYGIDEIIYKCGKCDGILEVVTDIEELRNKISTDKWKGTSLSVWRYIDFLPIKDKINIVTLNEGGTGLHRCKRLAEKIGLKKLFIKFEGENPTGSFKDRGMTVGVSKARELGVSIVICASTGNTSASLAAYAAKSGRQCIVLVPAGKIGVGKLAQAIAHGARLIQVKGNFDDSLDMVFQLCERNNQIYLLNSVNPFRIEGQKTIAFEVSEQLGVPPDCMVMPVGNAGNISAAWKGFNEFEAVGLTNSKPRMIGIQAEGASPIVNAYRKKKIRVEPILFPETVATAIRIGNPVSWRKALNSIYESNGHAETVTDQEILDAQRLLAQTEGIFAEPASATPIASLRKLLDQGVINKSDSVVCVATGHGLKDADVITRVFGKPIEVEADIDAIEKSLNLLVKYDRWLEEPSSP